MLASFEEAVQGLGDHISKYIQRHHNSVYYLCRQGEAMPEKRAKDRNGRGETINLRASRNQKVLIDRAAEALGRSRSDFMLDTACREAESVLLDRRYFTLSEEAFKRFTRMLDSPPKDNPRLRRLLQTRAPWDR